MRLPAMMGEVLGTAAENGEVGDDLMVDCAAPGHLT